jgi:membrane protein YqaA with SNARE-associated domain
MVTLGILISQLSRIVWRFGGLGLIAVGILDNSLVPVPGSQDFFTILLAAHHRDWWFYYALMSTAGATLGGYLTYRLGHKGGEEALKQRLREARVKKVSATFEKYGFAAVFVPALMPPPVPMVPFVLGAGALRYPLRKFLSAYASARFIRYTIAASLAALYGRRVLSLIARNTRMFLIVCGILVTAAVVLVVAYRLWEKTRAGKAITPNAG